MLFAVPALFWLFAAPTQFSELSKQAAAARESDRIPDAIKLYGECTRLRPAWAEGWWYLGTLQYDRNAYDEATSALTHFVKLEPAAAPGWALLGLSEFETRHFDQSLEHLTRALNLKMTANLDMAKVTRYHASLLWTQAGQFETAQHLLAELAMQGGEDADTILATGLAALRLPLLPTELAADQRDFVMEVGHAVNASFARKAAQAAAEFSALVKKYPDTPQIHNLYGVFLLANDPDQAILEWKRELEISPEHVPAMLELSFEYLKRGDAANAATFARDATRLAPRLFVARLALGRALLESGDAKAAIIELEQARNLATDSAETHVALASAYAKAGRSQDAARERAEFLRLNQSKN